MSENDVPRTLTFRTLVDRWMSIGAGGRVAGVDLARALAVVGMMGAHVAAVDPELIWSDPSTWDGVVHGHSSALFGVIAGVSLALMTGGATLPTAEQMPKIRLQLLGRGLIVFAIGLGLEMLGTMIAVILTVYGAIFVGATLFIRWRRRTLIIVGGAIAVLAPILIAVAPQLAFGGAGSSFILGTYPLSAWLPFVFAGLVLGRSDLRSTATRLWAFAIGVVGTVIGYGADSLARSGALGAAFAGAFQSQPLDSFDTSGSSAADASAASSVIPFEEIEYSKADAVVRAVFNTSPHSGATADIVASVGLSLVIIAICLVIATVARPVVVPLLSLGSMPLTAYTIHVVWFGIIQATNDGWSPDPSNGLWLTMGVVITLLALVWRLFANKGPLESLTATAARAMTKGLPAASVK